MTEEQKEARSRWRFTLVLTGMLFLPLLALAGVLLIRPALWPSRHPHSRATCKSHLRQIGLACHMWAEDHDDRFPPNLESLVPDYVDNPKAYVCPGARRRGLPGPHYRYVPGLKTTAPGDHILAYELLDNHGGEGFNVLFCDAHVEWWPAEREPDLQDQLARQEMAIEAEREKADTGE